MQRIKLKSGRWAYKAVWVDINGKRRSHLLSKRKLAHEYKIEKEEEKKRHLKEKKDEKDPTLFSNFARKVLEDSRLLVAPGSYKSYLTIVNTHLIPFFKDTLLEDLTKDKGTDLIKHLKIEKKLSHSTINKITGYLKSILHKAVASEYVNKTPFTDKKLKVPKHGIRFWTGSEIKKFLKGSKYSEYHDMYLLTVNMGYRRGEVAGLRWKCVDFDTNIITTDKALSVDGFRQTKTGNVRKNPINETIRKMLLARINGRKLEDIEDDYIFTEKNGEPIKVGVVCEKFKLVQTKVGMRKLIVFHDLRHTFATQFMLNGGTLFDLMELLGHTDQKTTKIYAHFSPDHFKDVKNIVEFGED